MNFFSFNCPAFSLDIRQCFKKDGSFVFCGFYSKNNSDFEYFCYETLQEAFEHFCQLLNEERSSNEL